MQNNNNYNVYKFYQDGRRARLIKRNLTLNEAQKICNDPETSSHTARQPKGCDNNDTLISKWDVKQKHWFYGYGETK